METEDDALSAPWDRAAATYHEDFRGQADQLVEPTLDAAGVGAGSKVLDVGTGTGLLAEAAVHRGAEVTGTDISDGMIAAARARVPGVQFAVAPAERQPVADGAFDAVVMGLLLFMLPDPAAALAEVRRTLRPGGRLACSLWRFPLIGHALFYDRVGEHLPAPPVAGRPPLLGVSDGAVLIETLETAGFGDVRLDEVDVRWSLPDGGRVFDSLVVMQDLSHLDDATRAELRSGVVADAEVYRDGDIVRIPFPALVLSGTRTT